MLADDMPDTERTDHGSTARERIGRGLERVLDETMSLLTSEIESLRSKSEPPSGDRETLPSVH